MTLVRNRRNAFVARDDGFTLIEVIVALALFALITVLVLGGIQGGRKALEKANLSNKESTLDATQGLIRGLITEARPISISAVNAEMPVVMSGEQSQIEFVSSFTVEGQFAGLYISTLGLVPQQGSGGTGDLVLRQRLYRPAVGISGAQRVPEWNTVLIKNVTGVRFRYFGASGEGLTSDWMSFWQRFSALPELVEVSLSFPAGDERSWRSLVVPLAFAE